MNESWELYKDLLNLESHSYRSSTINAAKNSLAGLKDSPLYQEMAKRNGNSQPMGVTRKDAMECKIIVMPNDEMYIGDIIDCFNEKWLVVDSAKDEYGLTTGKAWLCNHQFKFQNNSSEIIQKYGVIDDGSYSSKDKKELPVTISRYMAYLPIDEETRKIYVDKRFTVGKISNAKGEDILEVYKVIWIDTKSKNFGEGSHIMELELEKDVFNIEKDNISEMICDYIMPSPLPDQDDSIPDNEYNYSISGRDTIRIGTTRKYIAEIKNNDGSIIQIDSAPIWKLGELPSEIIANVNGSECSITVPLDSNLIGCKINISVEDSENEYGIANKSVEVITIG